MGLLWSFNQKTFNYIVDITRQRQRRLISNFEFAQRAMKIWKSSSPITRQFHEISICEYFPFLILLSIIYWKKNWTKISSNWFILVWFHEFFSGPGLAVIWPLFYVKVHNSSLMLLFCSSHALLMTNEPAQKINDIIWIAWKSCLMMS